MWFMTTRMVIVLFCFSFFSQAVFAAVPESGSEQSTPSRKRQSVDRKIVDAVGTDFLCAVYYGDFDKVCSLLAQAQQAGNLSWILNYRDKDLGDTALMFMARRVLEKKGLPEKKDLQNRILSDLLSFEEINLSIKDNIRSNALMYAIMTENKDAFLLLVNHSKIRLYDDIYIDLALSVKDKETSLFFIKELLKKGAFLSLKSLTYAIMTENKDVFLLLVNHAPISLYDDIYIDLALSVKDKETSIFFIKELGARGAFVSLKHEGNKVVLEACCRLLFEEAFPDKGSYEKAFPALGANK